MAATKRGGWMLSDSNTQRPRLLVVEERFELKDVSVELLRTLDVRCDQSRVVESANHD